MRRRALDVLAFLVLVSAVGCAAPAPPRERAQVTESRRRAVLVSFDGVAGERLARLMEDSTKLPAGGFRALAARGFHAVRSIPPTPSLTAVSHITHVTGALPDVTGIVSNLMFDFANPFPATRSGFEAPIRAETLWQAARRQGKRIGVMLYPGADGNGPDRTTDWMMTWPRAPLADGRLHSLDARAWAAVGSAGAPRSFSQPRRTVLSFGKTRHSVAFVALDSTDDARANYDRLLVRPEAGVEREIAPDEWFPVEVASKEGRTGAWCKLISLSVDLSRAEIYLGDLSRTEGHPEQWVHTLDERIGFWPGVPDSELGADSLRPEIFLEQTERLVDFLTRADLLALARPDWDLLLIYQPEVDETSHEFLLIDPAQPGFTRERSQRFLSFVERSYELADRSLAAIAGALGPSDSLFVTSDHGMTAIRGTIAINRILADAGLVQLDGEGKTSRSSALFAVTSSGITHVHANPARAPEAPSAIDRAERVLGDFRVGGESPFDVIVRRENAGDLGLNAPESGDLIVLAKPGYQFSSRADEGGGAVAPARTLGGHGYRNVYPELDATFFAAGPGIASERVDVIRSWQIAARVAKALGIEPPRHAARD